MAGDASETAVAFSPDGSLLASSGKGTVQLWDAATRRPVGKPLNAKTKEVSEVAFSPDGSLLAADGGSAYDTVMLWDPATRERVGKLVTDTMVFSVAFSPDGSLLAAGGDDGAVRLWDPFTGRLVRGPPHSPTHRAAAIATPDTMEPSR
ncbi:WD40 repeat domain-containing protein [Streptomyces sp. NPDC059753]|uniref:WD40 repeat domain-containing protein n=1 Tax=Streptomyces sp. NPDC059753 TaxID=3346933 RepID=UPI00364F0D6B